MNICLSGGTGVGKTTLLNNLPERINVVSETKVEVMKLISSEFTNVELFFGTVEYQRQFNNIVFDRSPIDWLVGCVMRHEIDVHTAYQYACEIEINVPTYMLIVPVPPYKLFKQALDEASKRTDHWKVCYPCVDPIGASHKYYEGAELSFNLGLMLTEAASKYNNNIRMINLRPDRWSMKDCFYSWQKAAKDIIIDKLG